MSAFRWCGWKLCASEDVTACPMFPAIQVPLMKWLPESVGPGAAERFTVNSKREHDRSFAAGEILWDPSPGRWHCCEAESGWVWNRCNNCSLAAGSVSFPSWQGQRKKVCSVSSSGLRGGRRSGKGLSSFVCSMLIFWTGEGWKPSTPNCGLQAYFCT